MNWGRVKTVFIIFFLICDLFLLANLIVSERKQSIIPKDVIDSTISLLKTNNISVDPALISRRTNNMPYIEAENVITDHVDFSEKILGDGVTATGENTYENDNGVVRFSGDSFSAEFKTPFAIPADEKAAEKTAAQLLEGWGLELSDSERVIAADGSGYTISYFGTAEDFPVFGSHVEIKLTHDGLVSAFGMWFNPAFRGGDDYSIKSPTSMLIDFIPVSESDVTPVTVTAIALGYRIPGGEGYHKSAVLIPSMKITTSGGTEHFSDARNPE